MLNIPTAERAVRADLQLLEARRAYDDVPRLVDVPDLQMLHGAAPRDHATEDAAEGVHPALGVLSVMNRSQQRHLQRLLPDHLHGQSISE